jgi:hypothetical protein
METFFVTKVSYRFFNTLYRKKIIEQVFVCSQSALCGMEFALPRRIFYFNLSIWYKLLYYTVLCAYFTSRRK